MHIIIDSLTLPMAMDPSSVTGVNVPGPRMEPARVPGGPVPVVPGREPSLA